MVNFSKRNVSKLNRKMYSYHFILIPFSLTTDAVDLMTINCVGRLGAHTSLSVI